MSILINVIDHRPSDHQPVGEIIRPWLIRDGQMPNGRYADFCALYHTWIAWMDSNEDPPHDIIGFFGYRKYLADPEFMGFYPWKSLEPAHAPDWWSLSEYEFNEARHSLVHWSGDFIKTWLAQYDILQGAPFPMTEGRSMMRDFQDSRSRKDARRLYAEVELAGWEHLDSNYIYPYLFITRWPVFDRMMREMEPIRLALHWHCAGKDSTNEEYKKRPMAYVLERLYTLWLINSGLSVKHLPIVHCWEKK